MSWYKFICNERETWRWVAASGCAVAFLAAIVFAATSVSAADCVVLSPDATSPITLRASPVASSAARGTLGSGQSLPLIALVPGWYELQLANGQPAFAAKRSTDIAPCPAPPVAPAPVAGGGAAVAGIYELHAIDVGTGLSLLVRGPDFVLLYDAGSNDDTARGNANRTIAYLKTLSPAVTSIDHVILSHPHRDHVELMPDVITLFRPHEVWNSGAYNDICGYRNFLIAVAADPSIQYHTATQDVGPEAVELSKKNCYGDDQPQQTVTITHAKRIDNAEIALGASASMTFLYADGSKRSDFNQNSLVVRLNLGSHRVLLMGDAQAGARAPPSTVPTAASIEGKLLACCVADLKADVLVAGHHGSKTSSRKKLLDAVGATIFIISAGPTKYQSVVLPDAEVVTELEARGQVFRTDLDDDQCKTSPDKVGPDNDGQAGGCDNVLVTIPATGPISVGNRLVSD
jgi:beta-lactamase superfamily II metal-dependent hydrolase